MLGAGVVATALLLSTLSTASIHSFEFGDQERQQISFSRRSQWMVIASGICPQNRKTRSAPSGQRKKTNPLPPSTENFKAGERLYQKEAKPTACRMCHGIRGNGNGRLAPGLEPPPRNFTCAETMREISDGQMFWIIKNGSKGTKMPAHESTLTDREIWQIIHYIRKFQN